MKINRIELFNIGSYEGLNVFDIKAQSETGKISVIGGKNGAGKTTLFSGIKLCLYGHKESGYQAINTWYKSSIKKLVNDKAKLENNAQAYVLLNISIFSGQDWDDYELKRSWNLNEDEFECFEVSRNKKSLDEEEITDFENYLLNILPPELFELYFFDGEQIADFFLEEASGSRIKTAFMTICGYDTFEILYKNFKRMNRTAEIDNEALDKYFEAEDELAKAEKELHTKKSKIQKLEDEIIKIDTKLSEIEKKFTSKGGVTVEEWNNKFLMLKNEERIREEKNSWVKNAMNEIIPYIILRGQIEALSEQIIIEQEQEKTSVLSDATVNILPKVISKVQEGYPEITEEIKEEIIYRITKEIKKKHGKGKAILNLSKNEYQTLSQTISAMLNYKPDDIISAREEIKASIIRSQQCREDIETSNVKDVDSYLKEKENLLKDKEIAVEKKTGLLDELKDLEKHVERLQAAYKLAEKSLDKQLKNESISNLTTRSIVFLDALQKRLFESEIKKVQQLFMKKINQLVRKENFISDIYIDDDFNIHVYKQVQIDSKGVCDKIESSSIEDYKKEFGDIHCQDILNVSKCASLEEFIKKHKGKNKHYDVMLEFDKTTMSKGEKQVFIMALYWAITQLCNREIPFIIDTPFARIDTEHRAHITEYFFKELQGQIIIFSTNEEITEEHMGVIGKDLQSKFLIENIDNKKTTIRANTYFGE